MANRPASMQLVANACKLPARGASRLQACINVVELVIIANSIALDSVLKAVCTAKVHYSSHDDDAWKRTTERTLSVP